MINYALLEEGTMRVLETGTRDSFDGLHRAGVIVMSGRAPSTENCWFDGERFCQVPTQPGEHYEWCWKEHKWLDLWAPVRQQRAVLLAESDVVAWDAEKRGELAPLVWREYRQALRDITKQSDPRDVVWPAKPSV